MKSIATFAENLIAMKKFITLIAAGVLAIATASSKGYENPTGKEFPILGWYSIQHGGVTPERFKEMRECGFNISFSTYPTKEDMAAVLDAAKGSGVKVMVSTYDLPDNTTEVVNYLKHYKNIAGWFLRDEPTAHSFADLRAFRDRVEAADSSRMTYLNLFPYWVDANALGTDSYEEYVQRFSDEVDLQYISYDCYPVVKWDGRVQLRPGYYENLEIIRNVARSKNKPFWAFTLSTSHGDYPVPTREHLRIQAFSDLAYGAQCIQYFTYYTPVNTGEPWTYHDGPINAMRNRAPVYDLVKEQNREIQNLSKVFLGAEAVDVWHTGQIPRGTTVLPADALPKPFTSIEADGQGVLVSHLVNGKKEYLMILNRDIDNAQTVTMERSSDTYRITPDGKQHKTTPAEDRSVKVAPADYLLYRIK